MVCKPTKLKNCAFREKKNQVVELKLALQYNSLDIFENVNECINEYVLMIKENNQKLMKTKILEPIIGGHDNEIYFKLLLRHLYKKYSIIETNYYPSRCDDYYFLVKILSIHINDKMVSIVPSMVIIDDEIKINLSPAISTIKELLGKDLININNNIMHDISKKFL